MTKYIKYAGKNERSASKSEYFSWINNTNEGSTEAQTLKNLAFFKYLYDNYSMVLDIYAFDAGNIDGSMGVYDRIDSEKIRKQFPNGFKKVSDTAKEINTRLGVWIGPDGFGDTKDEMLKRKEMLVSLCRDLDFALFKFDRVCSDIREDHIPDFIETMVECREYSKDLIALNHRLSLGDATKYTTTFLWEGMETYVDVHGVNYVTAPHNRAFIFKRGFTPDYKRLTEDHGVCLSSSIDYFEDDLVYQAFNRSLILSPEIYGNPWFLMDSELPKLARVFNLARTYSKELIKGIPLDKNYGANAFSRGNDKKRFIATGNDSWNELYIDVKLDETIGLKTSGKIVVSTHFPYEEFVGIYEYGDIAKVRIPAFRACLIEVSSIDLASDYLIGCKYEILHEKNNVIDKVNIIQSNGNIKLFKNGMISDYSNDVTDVIMKEPSYLGEINEKSSFGNKRFLYESAYFTIDNDNLELRTKRRSGETMIKEVKDARDAFFNQESYKRKGIDSSSVFDGNKDTIFDTKSKIYEKGHRVNGGCLRVDLGDVIDVDTIEIEYFNGLMNPDFCFAKQELKDNMQISSDLKSFGNAKLISNEVIKEETLKYIRNYFDIFDECDGLRYKATFGVNSCIRYFLMNDPVDRIFSIKAFKDGNEIKLNNPRLSNLFSPYERMKTSNVLERTFNFKSLPKHAYLAIAIEGKTGNEGVALTYSIDGKFYGAPNRAPQYPANVFEYFVKKTDGYYTFFIDLDESMLNKDIKVFVQFNNDIVPVDAYLCDRNVPREGIIKTIELMER